MLFSSFTFLFLFLPILLLLIFVFRKQQNGILLLFSLLFYAWGGPYFIFVILFSILVNYFIALKIQESKKENSARNYFIIGLILNLFPLLFYKYTFFVIWNINAVFDKLNWELIPNRKLLLPIGISFFTFQAISYLTDVYRKEVKAQKNIKQLALYISLFPQLIAGPIVRYKSIEKQLKKRKMSWMSFGYGVERFLLGLGKKVILADSFAPLVDSIFSSGIESINASNAWLGIFLFALQVYFDFSGYSDMAIGLGRMFGFSFPENFNYPYISKSISEFWQRWHISLTSWFKDYLYIPLGGNRVSKNKWTLNICFVFILTGIWHGANWNFVLWGALQAMLLILEKYLLKKWLHRIPSFFQHLYALPLIITPMVFIRTSSTDAAYSYFKSLFSFNFGPFSDSVLLFFNHEIMLYVVIAILWSTPFFFKVQGYLKQLFWFKAKSSPYLHKLILSSYFLGYLFLFFSCMVILLSNSYTPFIYFAF